MDILTLLFFKLNAVGVPLFFDSRNLQALLWQKSLEEGRFIVVDLVEQLPLCYYEKRNGYKWWLICQKN